MRGEDERQLERVSALVHDVLAPEVVGMYLFGSAALAALGPHSDLDVLGVSKRPATRADKQRLVDGLLAISGRGEGRRVELTIVVESEIRAWRHPASFDFQYGDWLRHEFERGNVEPWTTTSPDLALLITMALLANAPVLGPPPAEVFDPVPREDLVSAMVASLDALVGKLGGTPAT